MTTTRAHHGIAVAVLVILAVAVYAPGFNGPFLLDDRENPP